MDQITLHNFRCFREEQTARLAPLTLLVGENSTGKTSFMAMLKALWDVAYRHRMPDFKEAPYDLGSFDEIVHHRGRKEGRAGKFEAGFKFSRTGENTQPDEPDRFEAVFEKKGTIPIPAKRLLSCSATDAWVELALGRDGAWELMFGTPRGSWKVDDDVSLGADDDFIVPLAFYADLYLPGVQDTRKGRRGRFELKPLRGSKPPDTSDLALIERMCSSGDRYLHEPLYASAPVRSKPRRTYDPSRASRDPDGDHIPMYLSNVYSQDKEQWKILKTALERFGSAAGLFDELFVTPLGKTDSGPFQLRVRKFDGKASRRVKGELRNLIDVGYGVSQVLPVVTELLRRDASTMFLLQQPEVHLHPSAQAELGTLFCQVASSERQLVVETHSDHLFDRVRMDVRDGTTKLQPEDVSILFFERTDLGQ